MLFSEYLSEEFSVLFFGNFNGKFLGEIFKTGFGKFWRIQLYKKQGQKSVASTPVILTIMTSFSNTISLCVP